MKVCHRTVSEFITCQLKTRNDRSFGGHARALAVSSINIAVGTSRGLILIFGRENRRLLQRFLF